MMFDYLKLTSPDGAAMALRGGAWTSPHRAAFNAGLVTERVIVAPSFQRKMT
jgi:hypothetical protein